MAICEHLTMSLFSKDLTGRYRENVAMRFLLERHTASHFKLFLVSCAKRVTRLHEDLTLENA